MAQPAHDGARVQRLPLGRAHAGRRRPRWRLRARIEARVQRYHATMRVMRHLFTPEGDADLVWRGGAPAAVGIRLRRHAGADRRAGPRRRAVPVTTLRRLHRLHAAAAAGGDLGSHGGRSATRLGFEPAHCGGQPRRGGSTARWQRPEWQTALDGVRDRLRGAADRVASRRRQRARTRGASLALHYRMAADRGAALELIDRSLEPIDPGLHVFGGKMVTRHRRGSGRRQAPRRCAACAAQPTRAPVPLPR